MFNYVPNISECGSNATFVDCNRVRSSPEYKTKTNYITETSWRNLRRNWKIQNLFYIFLGFEGGAGHISIRSTTHTGIIYTCYVKYYIYYLHYLTCMVLCILYACYTLDLDVQSGFRAE